MQPSLFALSLCLTTTIPPIVDAAKILVSNPTLSSSHVAFTGAVADILAEDGHEITVLQTVMDPRINFSGSRLAKRHIRFESPETPKELFGRLKWHLYTFIYTSLLHEDLVIMAQMNVLNCKGLIMDHELMDELRREKFDIILHEPLDQCPIGLSELLNVSKIAWTFAVGVGPFHSYITGLPQPASYVPQQLMPFSDEMTLWQRAINIHQSFLYWLGPHRVATHYNALFRQYSGPDFPDTEHIARQKVQLALVNGNEWTRTARPLAPFFRYVGTATIQKPQELGKEWETILTKRPRGAILFSLGTIAEGAKMPETLRNELLTAFDHLAADFSVIVKTQDLELKVPENVYLFQTVPQVSLLAHPKLRVFVTHAGFNSINEAIFYAVPTIAVPIFADQDSNALTIANRNLSIILDHRTLTWKTVVEAVYRMLGEKDGQEPSEFELRSRQIAARVRPLQRLEKAELQRIVRELADFGLEHLQLRGRLLSYAEYYNLDVLAVFVVIVLASFLFVLGVLKCIWHVLFGERRGNGQSATKKAASRRAKKTN